MWKDMIRGMLSQKSNNSSSLGDLTRTGVVVVAGGAILMVAGVGVEAAVLVVGTRMAREAAVDTKAAEGTRVGVDIRAAAVGTRMAAVVVAGTTTMRDTTSRGTTTTGAGVAALVAIPITTTREEASREVARPMLRGLS
jgi:hypothetical protein